VTIHKASERTTVLSAQMPTELRDGLSQLARQHDRSMSAEMREAVRLHLGINSGGSSLRPIPAERVEASGVTGQSNSSQPAGQENS
jgi:hypothetical protein